MLIGGKEVGLKNASDYKDSTGDEAATKSLGMGVISHTIQGTVKHAAWSFDVQIEGQNVIRHMDLTTHNHMNCGNGAVTLDKGAMFQADVKKKTCKDLDKDQQPARENPPRPAPSLQEQTTTLTTAQYQAPNGSNYSMKAFSRQMKGKDGWAQGVGPSGTSKLKGCSGFDYKQKDFMPHSSHTEARMIEDIFATGPPNPAGRLLMKIAWNSEPPDHVPCPACENLICAAEECGLIVRFCDDKNKEQKVNC